MQIERSPADMLYTDTYIGYRIEDKRKTTAEVDSIWDDCSALEIALSETTRLAEDRRVWRSAIFNLGFQRVATLSSSSEHYKNNRRRRHEQIDGTGCIKISASSTYRPDTFVVTYRWCSTVHTCVGPTDDTKQDKSADCRSEPKSSRSGVRQWRHRRRSFGTERGQSAVRTQIQDIPGREDLLCSCRKVGWRRVSGLPVPTPADDSLLLKDGTYYEYFQLVPKPLC